MSPGSKPYLLFDAGGTLLFPDIARLAEAARAAGHPVGEEVLFEAFCRTLHQTDQPPGAGQACLFPRGLFAHLFELAGLPPPRAGEAGHRVQEEDRRLGLWRFTYPWVRAALVELARMGYRMSVVSNSDGRVARLLAEAGLAPFFEAVFDSAVVGLNKPDPRFFQHALARLDVEPGRCLYLGDLYWVDVLGANRAGIGAVQVDPLGLSRSRPGLRIPSVAAYPPLLEQLTDPGDPRLHPLRPA